MDGEENRMSRVCKALSDPTRRRILDLLSREEKSLQDLCYDLAMPPTSVQYQIRQLRESGLIFARSSGKILRYSVLIDGFVLLDEYLGSFLSETEDEDDQRYEQPSLPPRP